ncbi:hypothetical protein Ahy_B09g097343 [Arachis hypogaea]|uniref:Transposase MuDR plant domain-containing protein n=1 Tax=Arachis hypogaea TaxID=3818 RepID=A0A444XPI1_ARAHY|nr:hypothetical protein Ahy_B09g097343 [Arachis hypogaea]
MKFNSREAHITVIKDYTIRRGVDYQVYESKLMTFYAKCTQYSSSCDWLIRVNRMRKRYYWDIRRCNNSHACTKATISQDHSKLDSNTIAEAIKPLVEDIRGRFLLIFIACLLTPFIALLLFTTLVLLSVVVQLRVQAIVADPLGHRRDPGSRSHEVDPPSWGGGLGTGSSLFEGFLRSLPHGGHGVVVEAEARGFSLLANLLAWIQMPYSHLGAHGLPYVRG